jgi:hypothetical protein
VSGANDRFFAHVFRGVVCERSERTQRRKRWTRTIQGAVAKVAIVDAFERLPAEEDEGVDTER